MLLSLKRPEFAKRATPFVASAGVKSDRLTITGVIADANEPIAYRTAVCHEGEAMCTTAT